MRSMRAPANPAAANSSAAPSRMRSRLDVILLAWAGANRRMLLNDGEDATKTDAATRAAHSPLADRSAACGDGGGRRVRAPHDRRAAGAEAGARNFLRGRDGVSHHFHRRFLGALAA